MAREQMMRRDEVIVLAMRQRANDGVFVGPGVVFTNMCQKRWGCQRSTASRIGQIT